MFAFHYFHIVVILVSGRAFFSAEYIPFPLTFTEGNYLKEIFHFSNKPYQE